ncbi:MAG: hypothetical protein HS115_02015 [Spirochaetales bacterium]|nr:hypothetical protein [Spirochaetales bacterium]
MKLFIIIYIALCVSCLGVENSPYDTARGGVQGFFLLDALAKNPDHTQRIRFLVSTDAQSILESSGDGHWKKIDYSAEPFSRLALRGQTLLALGSGNDTYYSSLDMGRSFSSQTVPLGGFQANRIAACGDLVVVTTHAGGTGFRATTSLNGGQSWTGPVLIQGGGPASADLATCPETAAGTCSGFCMASGSGGGTHITAHASDGANWNTIAGLPAGTRNGAASGRQGILIGTSTGGIYHSSGDPTNFSLVDTALSYIGQIVHTGDVFLSVSLSGAVVQLRRSHDPASGIWTQTDVDFSVDPPTINSLTAKNGVVLLVGNRSGNPFILRSTDHGLSWIQDEISFSGITSLSDAMSILE